LKLGREGEIEDLAQLIQNQGEDELVELVLESLSQEDGPALLLYSLQGLQIKPQTESVRLKLITRTLKELNSDTCIKEAAIKTIIEEIEPGIRTLSCEGLAKLIHFLIRTVETLDNSTEKGDLSWIQVFATVLSEVEEKSLITPKNQHIEITGKEFRSEIIDILCGIRLSPRTCISICVMFQQLKMTGTETEVVFNKMNEQLSNAVVMDVAPLFHQLLKLFRHNSSCSGKLFASITQYFGSRLAEPGAGDEDNILHHHSREEVQQTQGIVIYYIIQAAKMGHPIANEIVKLAKSWSNFPAALMNEFNLFSCLALTSVRQWSDSVLDSIKLAISKGFSLEEGREKSVWFRTITPKLPDLTVLFSQVISESVKYGGWDLIGQGLVDIALLLLDTRPPLGKMNTKTRSIHSLGATILCRVVVNHSISAKAIIEKLTQRVIVNPQPKQYVDALRLLFKDATTFLMEHSNGTAIANLVENLNRMPSHTTGRSILSALVPIIKVNRSLKNPLILVLRKLMYSKSIENRETGVSGIFTLLKTFKISTNMNSSQLSQSSGSLSQLAADIFGRNSSSASNDLLCSELLGVLKRCYSLQPEVRMVLYEGMYDVVCKNPELCEGFLDLLNVHIIDMFGVWTENTPIDVDTLSSKFLVAKDGAWSISDPAGWFLHTVQAIVTMGQQLMDAGSSAVLDNLGAFLDSLTERYSEVEVKELWFQPQDNLDRKTPEGKKRCLEVEIMMSVYEALMDYVVTHGADKHLIKANLLLKLLHNHQALSNLLNAPKAKKAGNKEKGKKADGNDTVADVGGEKDKENKAPDRGTKRARDPAEFNMDKHAFSLRSLAVILQSVLENRVPDTQAALGRLRQSDSFLSYLQTLLKALLERSDSLLSKTGDEDVLTNNVFRHLQKIAATLFRHSITSMEPVEDFLQPGSALTLTYLETMLTNFPTRKLALIESLAGLDPGSSTDINSALVPCLRLVADKLAELNGDLENNDEVCRKMASVVGIYSVLLKQLDGDRSTEGPYDWLKRFTEQFTSEDVETCKPVVKLVFLGNLRLTLTPSLCPRTAQQLHSIYGDLDDTREVEVTKNFGFLNEETAETVLPILVEHLENNVEFADNTITWLKSLLNSPSSQVDIAETELAITEQIAKIVNPTLELVNTSLPVGSGSDLLLKFLIKLYKVLGNLANYFFLRTRFTKGSVRASKFDKLVGIVGSQLSPNIYALITFIHTKYKEQEDGAKVARMKKKKVLDPNLARAKILRETKHIPTLIFHIETFEKNMAKVGKRMNQTFKFKLATARDFRIRLTEVEMKELDHSQDEESEGDEEEEEEEEA